MKTINITVNNKIPRISFEELKKYERNKLKDSKSRNVGDLEKAILKQGFSFPFIVWEKGKYIIDGSGRMETLERLEKSGYAIPDLPVVSINTETKLEAKKLVLTASSKYGKETNSTISDFILDLNLEDLSFVDIDGFDLGEVEISLPKNKEINLKDLKGKTKMTHTCPKCNFEFTTSD